MLRISTVFGTGVALIVLAVASACGSSSSGDGSGSSTYATDPGGDDGGGGTSSNGTSGGFGAAAGNSDAGPTGCTGLQCQQASCASGSETTVTGTVYAPNGTLPLYNVILYVPNSTVEPLTQGITCDQCGAVASGEPIVTTLSNPDGTFKLTNVPVGANIPLVMQLGKWRRQITIPSVASCTETKLTDADQTRLPEESKGRQHAPHCPHDGRLR